MSKALMFIKDMFLERVENEESGDTPTKIQQPSNNVENVTLSVPTQSSEGLYDEKIFETFQKILDDNNIPGIDYIEFKMALRKTLAAGLPKKLSIQTTFDTLKIGDAKLTKQILLDSIIFYTNLLNNEELEFNSVLEEEIDKNVNSIKDTINALKEENALALEEIEKLKAKISNNQNEIVTLNEQSTLAKVKIEQTSLIFNKTLEIFRKTLIEDKIDIETNIVE